MLVLTHDEVALIARYLGASSDTFLSTIKYDSRYKEIYRTFQAAIVVTVKVTNRPTARLYRLVNTFHRLKLVVELWFEIGVVSDFIERYWHRVEAIHFNELKEFWSDKTTSLSLSERWDLPDLTGYKRLESLCVHFHPRKQAPNLCLPYLKELELGDAGGRNGFGLLNFGPNLEVFRSELPRPQFANTIFPSLKVLEFHRLEADPQFSDSVTPASFPRLVTLKWGSNCKADINDSLPLLGSNLKDIVCETIGEIPSKLQSLSISQIHPSWPTTLKVLSLDIALPESFQVPASVEDLSVHGSFSSSLFDSCVNLVLLFLGYREFRRPLAMRDGSQINIPTGVMPRLKTLWLNSITVKSLRIDSPLITLSAMFCGLEELVVPPSIETLNLEGNKLTHLPVGPSLKNLKKLDLSRNLFRKESLNLNLPALREVALPEFKTRESLRELIVPPKIEFYRAGQDGVGGFHTVAFEASSIEAGTVCVPLNQACGVVKGDRVYKYHPETTKVDFTLSSTWHPSVFSFGVVDQAKICVKEPNAKVGSLLSGCTIRNLELVFEKDSGLENYPIGIPSSVEWLNIWSSHLSEETSLTFECLGSNPCLRELNTRRTYSEVVDLKWAFVGDNLPKIEYYNGRKCEGVESTFKSSCGFKARKISID